MSSMNHVILMGNLTRTPEIRRTPAGQAVSDLGLAVNERFRDREGKTVDRPCFVDVAVWGRQAEACGHPAQCRPGCTAHGSHRSPPQAVPDCGEDHVDTHRAFTASNTATTTLAMRA